MATHSSFLALRIPLTEEPGRFQSIRCRVRRDWSDLARTHVLTVEEIRTQKCGSAEGRPAEDIARRCPTADQG